MQLYKKVTFTTCSILALLISNPTIGQTEPHTWHTVSTTNGTWSAKLQMLNQQSYFTDRSGAPITSFMINPFKPQDYGFGFDSGADFDIAYTLTLIEDSKKNFTSKACVYVITASGPAKPDIRTSEFNGAKCDWKIINGVGENFIAS